MSAIRSHAVWIRKSTDKQEEEAQRNNVAKILKREGITVPQDRWFASTVSRASVASDPEHKRLLQLVEAGKVDVIFVESESRWGSIETAEVFKRIEHLRSHGVTLIDLTTGRDITAKGIAADVQNLVGAYASKAKIVGEADQGLRSRINSIQQHNSWPSGCAPYGYSKECLRSGQLIWVFEQTSRTTGTTRHVEANGKLGKPTVEGKITRKEKSDVIRLVPSEDTTKIENVQMVFSLYVKEGLSRRAIAKRMNDMGRVYYKTHWTPSLVDTVLSNAAYIGELHFGKWATGKFKTIGKEGRTTDAEETYKEGERVAKKHPRPVEDRIVKKDVHKAIIDKRTWNAAKKRLERERELNGRNYSSRNPDYWLKGLLYCGHCGKPMVGRPEKQRGPCYICVSFSTGRVSGVRPECGFHCITHTEAERMLLEYLDERGVEWEKLASREAVHGKDQVRGASNNVHEARLAINKIIDEGIKAFVEYADGPYADLSKKDRRSAADYFESGAEGMSKRDHKALAGAILRAEKAAAKSAQQELEKVAARHTNFTLAMGEADSPEQRATLRDKCRELEVQMAALREATVPVSQRLEAAYERIQGFADELKRVKRQIVRAPDRIKGELLKSVVQKMVFYWDKKFTPSSARPTRPRRTERNGRYRYTLKKIDIFPVNDPQGSW